MSTVKTNAAQIGQSLTATNNFTMYQPASPDGTVRWGVGNSGSVTDIVTLNSSGNVGIGTSSPASYSGYTTLALNNAVNGGVVDFLNNGTRAAAVIGENAGLILAGVGSRYVRFDTNGSERMRIDSSGNVGIGTGTPSSYGLLAVVGGTAAQYRTTGDNMAFNGNVGSTNSSYIRLQNTGGSTDFGNENGGAFINVNNSQYFTIRTGGNNSFRIDNGRNVSIGSANTYAGGGNLSLTGGFIGPGDGSYFGGGAYWDGSQWRNTVSSQGGWTIRNTGGNFTVNTGSSPGASGSVITLGERMRIDGSGRVQTPYQPSFDVRGKPTVSGSSVWTGWPNVEFNNGSNFNATTGLFTAPVNGVYFFNASDYGDVYRSIGLARNGSFYTEAYVGTLSGNSAQVTALIFLYAGDTVGVYYPFLGGAVSGGSGAYWHFIGRLVG